MKLNLKSDNAGISLVQIEGQVRLSAASADSLLLELLLGTNCYGKKLLLDFEKTPYMDSSGVSWLLNTHKKCRKAGGMLVLHTISPSIMQILKLLRVARMLNIAENESAALALVSGPEL